MLFASKNELISFKNTSPYFDTNCGVMRSSVINSSCVVGTVHAISCSTGVVKLTFPIICCKNDRYISKWSYSRFRSVSSNREGISITFELSISPCASVSSLVSIETSLTGCGAGASFGRVTWIFRLPCASRSALLPGTRYTAPHPLASRVCFSARQSFCSRSVTSFSISGLEMSLAQPYEGCDCTNASTCGFRPL